MSEPEWQARASLVNQDMTEMHERHTLHNGKLVWKGGAAIRHPGGIKRAPRVLFQTVPEPKTVKNRLHLDLRPCRRRVAAIRNGQVCPGAPRRWPAVPAPGWRPWS